MTIPFRYLVMVLGLISTAPLKAEPAMDHDTIRDLVEAGKILPLDEILRRHEGRIHGRILDLEVEQEHGRIVYEIEFMGEDGVIHEAYIDAAQGAWLKEEVED